MPAVGNACLNKASEGGPEQCKCRCINFVCFRGLCFASTHPRETGLKPPGSFLSQAIVTTRSRPSRRCCLSSCCNRVLKTAREFPKTVARLAVACLVITKFIYLHRSLGFFGCFNLAVRQILVTIVRFWAASQVLRSIISNRTKPSAITVGAEWSGLNTAWSYHYNTAPDVSIWHIYPGTGTTSWHRDQRSLSLLMGLRPQHGKRTQNCSS